VFVRVKGSGKYQYLQVVHNKRVKRDMLELCRKERESGRVPAFIEFVHAGIPEPLLSKLRSARRAASKEVSPKSS